MIPKVSKLNLKEYTCKDLIAVEMFWKETPDIAARAVNISVSLHIFVNRRCQTWLATNVVLL